MNTFRHFVLHGGLQWKVAWQGVCRLCSKVKKFSNNKKQRQTESSECTLQECTPKDWEQTWILYWYVNNVSLNSVYVNNVPLNSVYVNNERLNSVYVNKVNIFRVYAKRLRTRVLYWYQLSLNGVYNNVPFNVPFNMCMLTWSVCAVK